jgi:ACS family glucarate transporter-like MFS transporter
MLGGRRRYIVYTMLFLFWFIGYMDRVNMAIAAKAIGDEFALSPVSLGYLFSSFSWSYLILLLPMGILTDRWGTRRMAAFGMGLWSIGQMCTGLAGGFGSMLLARLALGAGESPGNAVCSRGAREWSPASERGLAMSSFVVASYAGSAFGAPLVAWLVFHAGWRISFVITGLIGVVWTIVWVAFFRSPENTAWIDEKERQTILRERDATTESFEDREGFRGAIVLLTSRSMLGLALTQGCLVYMLYLFLTWLPSYLQMSRGLSVMNAGLYTSVPYLVTVVLAILFSRLSDHMFSAEAMRTGARRVVVAGSLVLSATVLGIQFVETLTAVIVLITISLVFSATAASTNYALISDLLRMPGKTGKAFSIVSIGGNLFGVLAPIVTGYIVQSTGSFDLAFDVAGVLGIAGAVIVMTMTRDPIGETASPSSPVEVSAA